MKLQANIHNIVIFVEDPGAANYVAPLPAALADKGIHSTIQAVEPAASQLRSLGANFEKIGADISAKQILTKRNPGLVLVGTSENTDGQGLDLIDLARQLDIPTIGIVDGPANPDHRFSGGTTNPRQHSPNYVVLPDEQTRQAFVNQGYANDQVINCGHPHYDFVRQQCSFLNGKNKGIIRRKQGIVPEDGQKVVMFCAEISSGLDSGQFQRSCDYTLQGLPGHTDRTDIVLDEFLASVKNLGDTAYTVLRLHPKNQVEDFLDYLDKFDAVNQGGNSLEALFAADLVVGMTSMVLVEAALMEIPTVSIIPRPQEKDWLPTIAAGITPCCQYSCQIEPALRSALNKDNSTGTRLIEVFPSGATQLLTSIAVYALGQK
jgi:hypothetical protein